MAEGRFISYLRVSTDRQGKSGLGLEAQRAAVEGYLNGGRWRLLAEYKEIESGKRDDRPQLAKALKHCKVTGATLVIAKLDRLSRDMHFIVSLQKAEVKFVAADLPQANDMIVSIMAVFAEHERKMISDRTKAALAAAKAKGVKLGSPKGAAHLKGLGNDAAIAKVRELATERANNLADVVHDIQAGGVRTVRGIAEELNERQIKTPRGGQWHATSVSRLLGRISKKGKLRAG